MRLPDKAWNAYLSEWLRERGTSGYSDIDEWLASLEGEPEEEAP